ncbi:enoyl-CoA hydratase [Rhodococcus sp. CX]|uniref:enoyl-CoA hydratase n=1 Tax=Rhodococcus sp. CX TaxID=2789880 RepID=UPI0018CEEA7E|nr:enoyl-CoA hydratase [Rhodococcus sp. CX]MBH0119252.1 enoyl-CoA hydratase [Rhodococcus sp. CX]
MTSLAGNAPAVRDEQDGYEFLRVERHGPVAVITLNRPKALNALCDALTVELTRALDDTEADDKIGAVVLTGSAKAFAAGADIAEMRPKSFTDVYLEDFITASWERASTVRKPMIAAVAGYALGGGAELAMSCDFIIAADNAKFGQPEITLGILPGAGGTQRLTRAVGKSKAMDMVLTGRMIDAQEAERIGLVARIVPVDDLLDEAIGAATTIAEFSRPAVLMAKESVDRAFETSLAEGLRFERRMFHAAFATEDKAEGMSAFLDKRKPSFTNR